MEQKQSSFKGFQILATRASRWVGSKWAFAGALLLIFGWAATGPLFRYSDTWQLVINTSTTILTFLMIFLVQNAQNRDARAMQLKLDELLRAVTDARNEMIDLEDLSEEKLQEYCKEFEAMQQRYQNALNARRAGSKDDRGERERFRPIQ